MILKWYVSLGQLFRILNLMKIDKHIFKTIDSYIKSKMSIVKHIFFCNMLRSIK